MKRKLLCFMLIATLSISIVSCGKKKYSDDFSEFQWPKNEIAKMISVPESNIGKINHESEDRIYIEVGETNKEAYSKHVDDCMEKGFTVDYSKSDTTYIGNNEEGYHINIMFYEEDNVMSLSLSAPEEEDTSEEEALLEDTELSDVSSKADVKDEGQEPEVNTETEKQESEKKTEPEDSESLDAAFKEAVDSYEAFIDEYVSFMDKYQNSTDVASMITDYTNYMSKYTELTKKMEDLNKGDLTGEELKYYTEVMARCSQKLLDAAGSLSQ